MLRAAAVVLLLLAALPARADRAEAQRLVGEAFAAVKAGKEADGLRLADQAVRADPTWGEAYAARGVAHLWSKKSREAAADLSYAVGHGASAANYQGYLAQALCDGKRWHEALAAADIAVREIPQWDVGWHTRARARLELGLIDEAAEDWTQGLRVKEVGYLYWRARARLYAADLDACLADCAKWAAFNDPSDRCFARYTRTIALVLQEKYAEAQAEASAIMKELPTCFGGHVGMATLHALARDPKFFDPAKALEILSGLPSELRTVRTVNAQALVLAAAENYPAALEELAFHQDHPDWEAAALRAVCLWRLGDGAAARAALTLALRLNKYLPKHVEKNRVLAPLAGMLARAENEVKVESAAGPRREIDLERESFPLVAGLIESLAQRYRFAEAAEEYQAWLPTLSSPILQETVKGRARALTAQAAALDRLIGAINEKQYTDIQVKAGKVSTTVTAASLEGFDYTFAQGNGKGLWVAFAPAELADLLLRGQPDAATLLAIGRFGLARGLDQHGSPLLKRALDADPALKPELDAWLAARRGIELPPDGFVFHQNAFVTPEEKSHYEKGEVAFRGEWMPKKDRDQIAIGKVKIAGKWVALDEKKLTRLGYRKHQGKWLTPEEHRVATRQWANATEEKTARWTVRTNLGAEFAGELARVTEAAHDDLKAFFGREPKLPGGAKMTLLAFWSFAEYRDWCRETRQEDKLALRGFARTDLPMAATYDVAADPGETMRSAVHEAARLWILAAHPEGKFPDWLLEGLCGLFEGFAWNGKAYDFPHASPPQRALAKRAALAGLAFPLAQLTSLSRTAAADSGPRDSALWVAQCWAVLHFLERSPNPAHAGLLKQLVEAAAAGRPVDLAERLGANAGEFAKEFAEFAKGL